MVSQAVEQRGPHLDITGDAGPFAERAVDGDDDRGAVIEPADEVELATGLSKRQIAELRAPFPEITRCRDIQLN
jgi:hypothetical protein